MLLRPPGSSAPGSLQEGCVCVCARRRGEALAHPCSLPEPLTRTPSYDPRHMDSSHQGPLSAPARRRWRLREAACSSRQDQGRQTEPGAQGCPSTDCVLTPLSTVSYGSMSRQTQEGSFLTLSEKRGMEAAGRQSFFMPARVVLGFPGGTHGEEPACQCRRRQRPGFHPWVGKIPWRRAWQPTPVPLPGECPRTEGPGGLQSMGSQSRTEVT